MIGNEVACKKYPCKWAKKYMESNGRDKKAKDKIKNCPMRLSYKGLATCRYTEEVTR